MRFLSNSARSNSSSQVSSEVGDLTEAYAGQSAYEDVIDIANTVPLSTIFNRYKINCNQICRSIRCPFKKHKGGRENSSSFYYYHDTNSFYCFGCNTGGKSCHATHFVAAIEEISLVKAANKIIEVFKTELGDVNDDSLPSVDHEERLKIMLDFSNSVRQFYQNYSSEQAHFYIERACQRYDALNLKHSLDNDALARVVEDMKTYINLYEGA